MKESEFKSLDPIADDLFELADQWFESEAFTKLRSALREATVKLPPNYSVSVDVSLRVFDEKRQKDFPLITTGVNSSAGRAPHPANSDSSAHRYVVNGELCELPHDRCPHCWGHWDFKLQNPECSHCNYSLGKEIKLLLDSDECPWCEDGVVSLTEATCSKCGFTVDPRIVAWG